MPRTNKLCECGNEATVRSGYYLVCKRCRELETYREDKEKRKINRYAPEAVEPHKVHWPAKDKILT